MTESTDPVPRVGFVSLGCPKALVDSERILTQLSLEGYQLVNQYEGADLVIVNTCGFIDAAVDESLDAIGEALRENGRVIVTGCLGARANLIREAHPEVLAVTGPHRYEEVLAAVHAHLPQRHDPFVDLLPPQGIKLTPPHYAYLKISEGCNHRCTFCIIPSMRGDLVSRPLEHVMAEATRLVASGVQELLVVSQDTSAYGVDRRYAPGTVGGRDYAGDMHGLVEALATLGVWVRLHYVYPYPNVDRLLPLMAEGKLLPYLDVPFQHASPRILRAMRRPAAAEDNLARVQAWRHSCPDLTIRSTFIVGFPGETEADFELLLDFLKAAELDRVGCFTYSPVTGAAANALPDSVPESVKLERQAELMALQAGISARRLERRIGQRMQCLVDGHDETWAVARGPGDAPDIDGQVYIADADHLETGSRVEVVIDSADEHDLYGHLPEPGA
jgi:ribosomal protein S12 methylthiotransferase